MLSDHLNKKNLHHAYLIEGNFDEIVPVVKNFLKEIGIETKASADFSQIIVDSFNIEDMRNLKNLVSERGFTEGKKIFILGANSFLLEAQNGLLKIFEEPIKDTHFFVIVRDVNSLLKTFVSRFYVVKDNSKDINEAQAVNFLKMNLKDRIDFLKNLLSKEEALEENEEVNLESNNKKALNFLNELESVISKEDISKNKNNSKYIHHIFRVRRFLRMPGSSIKTLIESVAISIPHFKDMQSR